MNQPIKLTYKNARIQFDTDKEEWVAYLNTEKSYDLGIDEFKRNTSLQKLKDSIDRFNKKQFKPISIIMFDGYGQMRTAEIISFTETPGECWIRKDNDKRELIRTVEKKYSHTTKIYACENYNNEPTLLQINALNDEIEILEKELQKKKADKIHLIDSLQTFDIGGLAITSDEEAI